MRWASACAATAFAWKTNRPSGRLKPCTALLGCCCLAAAKLLQFIRQFGKPLASSRTHQLAAGIHYRPSVRTKWVALERNLGVSLFLLSQRTGSACCRIQSMKTFISIQLHQSLNNVLTAESQSNLCSSVLVPSGPTTKPELHFLLSNCPQALFTFIWTSSTVLALDRLGVSQFPSWPLWKPPSPHCWSKSLLIFV